MYNILNNFFFNKSQEKYLIVTQDITFLKLQLFSCMFYFKFVKKFIFIDIKLIHFKIFLLRFSIWYKFINYKPDIQFKTTFQNVLIFNKFKYFAYKTDFIFYVKNSPIIFSNIGKIKTNSFVFNNPLFFFIIIEHFIFFSFYINFYKLFLRFFQLNPNIFLFFKKNKKFQVCVTNNFSSRKFKNNSMLLHNVSLI